MPRRITHGKQAAERLARKWFRRSGIPMHLVGFHSDAASYVIIDVLAKGRVHSFRVPCWGARVLANEVREAIWAMKL